MIENNEVKITTSEAMEVLRIVKKLGLKDDISNAIETLTTLNNKKEGKFTELRRLIIKEVGLEEYNNLSDAYDVISTLFVLISTVKESIRSKKLK